jgi:glycosyltransferase involved in cell wall biosynthesis
MHRFVKNTSEFNVSVVIPCYKVTEYILDVIQKIGDEVNLIIVVDDCCPELSGQFVKRHCKDERVVVLFNSINLGVGGAVLRGYDYAIEKKADIIVKIDGDGQMSPSLIPTLIMPIVTGIADYTKGNRFFDLNEIKEMPSVRIFGNAVLSFMTKLSSGYWDIFDPTNGFTSIHASVARYLPFEKISKTYFFETDILFRLNTLRAVVVDVPMDSKYGEEISNLKVRNILGEFMYKHLRNLIKRIFYNYYLRNMSVASIELPLGAGLFLFGVIYGFWNWTLSVNQGVPATPGIVMISALPILMGMQLMLSWLNHDINSVPNRSIYPSLHFQTKLTQLNSDTKN